MSGIAGLLHLDRSPADPDVLQRMTGAVTHRGPDRGGTWVDGPAGLGHRLLATTPEAVHERQPLCDESGQVCMAMDGRVDNGADLRRDLEAKGAVLRDDTGAELVLKAYLVWGEDAPARILGDFAFAIWDGRCRALFCARDVFGIRPLTYYHGGTFFLIASELHQLFQDARVKRVPNEGMVAEYLSARFANLEETLWEGVLRLPAAHLMWVREGRVEKRRYWDFDFGKEIRYKTDEEYAEHFLALFKEAVRCRLRSNGPVGSHLSGGLDSSSVSVLANEILKEEGKGPLDTYSLVYPGMACDESEYIRATAELAGLRSHEVPPVPHDPEYYFEQTRLYQNFAGWPNGGSDSYSLALALKEAGTRVVLTGSGGNEGLEGGRSCIAELVGRGRFLAAFRCAEDKGTGRGGGWPLFLSYGLRPHIPSWARKARRALRRAPPGWSRIPSDQGRNRRPGECRSPAGPRTIQEERRLGYYEAFSALAYDMCDREAAFHGLEERHPLLDRTLTGFMFALPESQLSRRGVDKLILRNALRGRLPGCVSGRSGQAEFSELFMGAVTAMRDRGRCSPCALTELRSRGWIPPESHSGLLERVCAGGPGVWRLWGPIGIEIWYRWYSNLPASPPAPPAHAP